MEEKCGASGCIWKNLGPYAIYSVFRGTLTLKFIQSNDVNKLREALGKKKTSAIPLKIKFISGKLKLTKSTKFKF